MTVQQLIKKLAKLNPKSTVAFELDTAEFFINEKPIAFNIINKVHTELAINSTLKKDIELVVLSR